MLYKLVPQKKLNLKIIRQRSIHRRSHNLSQKIKLAKRQLWQKPTKKRRSLAFKMKILLTKGNIGPKLRVKRRHAKQNTKMLASMHTLFAGRLNW